MEDRQLISASLEDGTSIQIQACVAGREQDVALGKFAFSEVSKTIGSIAQALARATEKARPAETEIEFGLDIGVETGHLLGVLVGGSGNANFKVKLTWRPSGSESAPDDARGRKM